MNRNFEQRFRRKNHNNNSNSNFNNNNNNSSNNNFNNNAGSNSNFSNRSNNSFNNRNNSNNPGNSNSQNNNNRFQQRNKNNFESSNWKTRDSRNTRRPLNGRIQKRPNNNHHHSNNNRWSNNRQNDNQPSSERWFKVTVPMSAKLEPFYVVNAIKETGIDFTPFNYTTNGNAVVFYVQGEDLRDSIKSLSRRITAPGAEGLKLIFQIEKSPLPLIDITAELVQKLQMVMSKRFDANTNYLNLSQFSAEPEFLAMRLFVSLQRVNVCKQVVEIIVQNIPHLVSLNLSNNRIQCLDVFKPLVAGCKNLKQLDLSHNNINNVDHFDNLKGLNLETLNIDYNPFKRNMKDKSQEGYVRLMRARFPKVINLDGVSLPPPICFDVEETITLPEIKDSYIPSHLTDFVASWVKEYFALFDSNDREALSNMYFDQAKFSYTITRNFANLLNESRNLIRIRENQHREKLLRQGQRNVVHALKNLPKTEHVLQSFKIDIPLFLDNYIVMNITGLFKTSRPSMLKAFSRNFLIVSHGNKFGIVNDLLSITNPTVENVNFVKSLYKNDPNSQDMNFEMDSMMDEAGSESPAYMNQMMMMSEMDSMEQSSMPMNRGDISSVGFMGPSLVNPIATSSISNSQMNMLNNNNLISAPTLNQQPLLISPQQPSGTVDQNELTRRFAEVTGMNLVFSRKCLVENNFDTNEALRVFRELNAVNGIPPEAFKK